MIIEVICISVSVIALVALGLLSFSKAFKEQTRINLEQKMKELAEAEKILDDMRAEDDNAIQDQILDAYKKMIEDKEAEITEFAWKATENTSQEDFALALEEYRKLDMELQKSRDEHLERILDGRTKLIHSYWSFRTPDYRQSRKYVLLRAKREGYSLTGGEICFLGEFDTSCSGSLFQDSSRNMKEYAETTPENSCFNSHNTTNYKELSF